MKKTASMFLAYLIIFWSYSPVEALWVDGGYSGTDGTIIWTLDDDILTVSGNGKMQDNAPIPGGRLADAL